MVHSLTLINLGETVFPSGLALAWMSGGVSANRTLTDRCAGRDLTRREAEILDCLTAGASNKQIARDLGITEATVKIHMKSLIRKIGVRNRTQAALVGDQHRLRPGNRARRRLTGDTRPYAP